MISSHALSGTAARAFRLTPAILRLAPALCAAALAACSTLPPARTVGTASPSSAGASSEDARGGAASPLPGAEEAPSGGAQTRPEDGSGGIGADRPGAGGRAASNLLLEQSRAAMQAGSYDAAAASIERALRISPDDPSLWLELGEIKLATGDAQQAQLMARKAVSLAGGDRTVTARAERLIDAAGR